MTKRTYHIQLDADWKPCLVDATDRDNKVLVARFEDARLAWRVCNYLNRGKRK